MRTALVAVSSWLLVALVAAVIPAVSSAQSGGWLPAQDLGVSGRYATSGALSVDPSGRALLVNGYQGQGTVKSLVKSSSRLVGGAWSAPAEVLPGDQTPYGLRLRHDSQGNALAAWSNYDDRIGMTIRTAWRSATGVWVPAEDISLDGESFAYGPDVAFRADGSVTVIWSQLMVGNIEEAGDEVIRVRQRDVNGQWSAAQSLTPADAWASRVPVLAMDRDGTLYATWTLYNSETETWQVQVARQPDGESWEPASTISPAADDSARPSIAVDEAGNVTVAWSAKDEHGVARIYTARRDAGDDEEWSAPTEMWNGGPHFLFPIVGLAAAPDGRVTLVWGSSLETGPFTGRTMWARQRAVDGTWSATTALAPPDGYFDLNATWPEVVVDRNGRALVAWGGRIGGKNQLRAAVSSPEGGWEPAVTLSDAGLAAGRPQVAVDHAGYFTVSWRNDDGPTVVVKSRVFDPVPPTQDAVAVPTSGETGVPIEMSVSASDIWSSVASRWEFGDGTSASGDVVRPCYRAPGRYEVRVASTDAAGNVTTATRDITVAAGSSDRSCDPPTPPDPPADPRTPDDPPADGGPRDPAPPTVPPRGPVPRQGDPGPIGPVQLRSLRISHRAWRFGVAKGARRVQPRVRYRLSGGASVRFEVMRLTTGRRVGGRCRPTTSRNRARPACARRSLLKTTEVPGRKGQNDIALYHLISRRTLSPGRYELRLRAGAVGASSRSVTFRVGR